MTTKLNVSNVFHTLESMNTNTADGFFQMWYHGKLLNLPFILPKHYELILDSEFGNPLKGITLSAEVNSISDLRNNCLYMQLWSTATAHKDEAVCYKIIVDLISLFEQIDSLSSLN